MWHEARKIEKRIRGIMIDYRKRAERRTAYYQKMKEDPHQLLRLNGNKCKLYIDSRPDKPTEESQLVPWQGEPDLMIDRFDARSQLDYIPEVMTGASNQSSEKEYQVNYERYRTLVQIEATGVTEESYLKQLAIEEWYGKKQAEKAKLEKELLSKKKASIGYKYEDSSMLSDNSDNSDAESDLSDIDISVNVAEVTEEQRKSLDSLATLYGIADEYYCQQLMDEKKEIEFAKQLEEEEEERSKLSGRRGKRARRTLREKQKAVRATSPPSYAMRESPTYDPYSPPHGDRTISSSSRSPSPDNHGNIEYITEFGGTSNSPEKTKISASRAEVSKSKNEKEKGHDPDSRALHHTSEGRGRSRGHRSGSREHSSRRRGSKERRHSSRRGHSRSRSRTRSYSRSPRRRSRSRSYRRSRSRSRDRGRSRSRSQDGRYKKYRDSSSGRYRRRSSRRSRSGSYGRSRSRSRSYSRSRSRSRSRSPRSSASTSIAKKLEPQTSKKTSSIGSAGDKPKITPQERLKLRMQKQLSKQIKHDKQSERKKQDEKDKQRLDRDSDIYEIQRKIRYRGKFDYSRERTPSPTPAPRDRKEKEYRSRSSSKSPRTRAYEEVGWQVN